MRHKAFATAGCSAFANHNSSKEQYSDEDSAHLLCPLLCMPTFLPLLRQIEGE